MRKISVGTFPLIQIPAKERGYVDKYLINVLSDLITVNQISSSIYDDRASYITPMVILDYLNTNAKTGPFTTSKTNGMGKDDVSNERNGKIKTIKNAFKNTKNLYRSLSNDPFFKGHVFYPIYIEEKIKNGQYEDYKYDFLILSNDLIKNQILDEITYDNKITILFLVLKDILFPYTKLNKFGIEEASKGFRKYFSIYLETCKNENINPLDLFIKIINQAGKQKNRGTGSLGGLLNKMIDKGNHPNRAKNDSFIRLFGNNGEVKDASFLIGLTQGSIQDFLKVNDEPLPKDSTLLSRQYTQAKTHEYSKILSIIDALAAFNKQNNVTEEINSNKIITTNLKTEEGRDLVLNIDMILNDFETVFYKQFLEAISRSDKQMYMGLIRKLELQTKTPFQMTDEKRYNDYVDATNKLEVIQLDLNDAYTKVKAALGRDDDDLVDALDRRIDTLKNEFNSINRTVMVEQQYFMGNPFNKQKADEERLNGIKASIGLELDLFKAQLTGLYAELYMFFYSDEFKDEIIKNDLSIDGFNKNSKFISQIRMSIDEISNSFKTYYIDAIKTYLSKQGTNVNMDKVVNDFDNMSLGKNGLEKLVYTNILRPIYRKYGNPTIMDSMKIKNLRTEKNPLLRKLLSSSGIFKAYIMNEETILGTYDILHYLDTLKYEVGLISTPVSRVTSDINKINFTINRLGLSENPVFIVKNNNAITLSMPDHLSLSGQRFINKISMQDFLKVATVNYDKKLWSQENMFGGIGNNKNYNNINKSISKINAEIDLLDSKLSQAQAEKDKNRIRKDIANKNALLLKKELELTNIKQNTGNQSDNLSGNLDINKRDQYERRWDTPEQNGRYNDRPNNFNRESSFRTHRDGMDRLKEEDTLNQRDPYPRNYPNTENRNSVFSNPNVRNRYQQINRHEPYPGENNV